MNESWNESPADRERAVPRNIQVYGACKSELRMETNCHSGVNQLQCLESVSRLTCFIYEKSRINLKSKTKISSLHVFTLLYD